MGRYRTKTDEFDRVYVSTTSRFTGDWLAPTHVFRAFGLITDNELAHKCVETPPCTPADELWSYVFEIMPVVFEIMPVSRED